MTHHHRGFSLVEVMVAVFVLAIAMLGIAGLQTTSKRANNESTQRTTATMLAQSLLERIRANTDQISVYTLAGAGRTIQLGDADGIAATNCSSATCDTATLAMYDLYEFSREMAGITEISDGTNSGGLLLPTACIAGPVAPPGEIRVSIAWRGMTSLSNPELDACGAGSGRYDDADGDDLYRRVLVVNAFVE